MPRPQPPSPPSPHRLLALDPGSRRTGVAVSDELGLFAHPRRALMATSRVALLAAVESLVASEEATEVIVGVPLGLQGADTAQTAEARAFANELRSRLAVPVSEWDERFSTVEAGRYVRGRERRRSGDLDSAAAAVVLQAVLEARRGGAT